VSPSLIASLKGLLGLVALSPTALVTASTELGRSLAASRQGETPINRASASFAWQAGQGTTRDILVLSPAAKVTGGGAVDLGKKRLHMNLLADVTGVGTVPLVIEGALAAPELSVDKTALAKRAVTNLPGSVGKAVRDTGSGVLDAVKGFFGGDKKAAPHKQR
jgi:hypothetical protein